MCTLNLGLSFNCVNLFFLLDRGLVGGNGGVDTTDSTDTSDVNPEAMLLLQPTYAE